MATAKLPTPEEISRLKSRAIERHLASLAKALRDGTLKKFPPKQH